MEKNAGSPDRLEGRNPVIEALRAGRTINKIWVQKREGRPDPVMARIVRMARDAGIVMIELEKTALDQMAESHGHQGVIAQVAALRIADAAGVDAVVIPERRSVALDATVAKASAGAVEYVPVARVNNLTNTVLKLKEKGFWIAGTDADATQMYWEADWKGPMAIVVGSEGEGISKGLLGHCDFLVSIPMSGEVNSLNAAVATGIIVFEAVKQRRS
jgi:23S rRNA (guanosine2251-2'-O)-methyltransferase